MTRALVLTFFDIDNYYPFTFDIDTIEGKWDQFRLFPIVPPKTISSDWFNGKLRDRDVMYYPDDEGFLFVFIRLGHSTRKKRNGKPMSDKEAGRNCVRNFLSVVVC